MAISLNSYAQESTDELIPKRIYTTQKLKKVPVIDGDVSDAAWDVVEWSSDFTQKTPDEGKPPTHQTKFKVMYDAKYLYIAIVALDDNPELIQQRLTRRDGFAGDRVNVIIDSYHDKRTAFVFTTTAAGVKGEEITTQNGDNWDDSWNPIWYTDAKVNDKGWTTEMKIPFSQLRFGKAKEQIWGFNVNRTIFRKQERSLWQRIPNSQSGFVSEAGELHGLIDLVPQKQLEIQPFTVLQFDKYPAEAGNPFKTGKDFKINGGLDAKIGITNDLTLDLTINPDFGQVEADPGAIALDGFQVFFKEQRPFFVENKNIFDYRFANGRDNLFYSRRIGRNPHRSADLQDGEYAKEPINSTILGAAKFSGKTKSGWSIGILESVTSNEYAEIKQVNGETREEIVEPLTNYFVARVQKDFNERNSYLGGIFTATNRNLDGEFSELHKAAYTGGIDFRHTWHNRDFYLEGNGIMSHVLGSEEAIENTQTSMARLFQRVDATHVELDPTRTSLTGTGGRIEIGKQGGGNWRYNAGFVWRSPELELNDVGFLRQTDEMIQFSNIRYLWQVPTKTYRDIRLRLEQFSTFDFQGNQNRMQYEIQGNVNWINNWWTELGLGHKPLIYGNAYLRGGPRWRFADENFIFLFFGSDRSKKMSFTLGYVTSKAAENANSFSRYVFRMNYQPFDAFSMSLDTEFEKTTDKTQYVTTPDFENQERYILGNIDNQNWSTTLRLNYSINPNMSIQFYGQPYIARGRYSDFNYVTNATAASVNDRVSMYNTNQISYTDQPIALDTNNDGTLDFDYSDGGYLIDDHQNGVSDYAFENPDFSYVQFRTNLVARWEYIPGSELFFVWARGGVGYDDPKRSLSRSLRNQIIDQPLEDTFLIKATYRFVK
ncbi:carbohydrate binding protein, CBMnc family [Polaribacter sp. Hel1_85]|nr:carbohydrate binding protein, CBMnc family [Polaribacter sp. Hel1_85]